MTTGKTTTIASSGVRHLHRIAPYMAPAALLLVTLSHGLAYALHPGHARLLISPVIFLLYVLIDRRSCFCATPTRLDAARETQFFLRLFMLATALIVSSKITIMLAIDQDLIAREWYFSVSRTAALLVSLSFMVFGNYLPKMPSPWNHREEPFDWQGVHRFTGFALIITGIILFFAWSVLPIPDAKRVTVPVVFTMAVLVVSRKWYSLATWKRPGLS